MEEEWNGIKILIVEDVESNILFYKSAFKRTGATVLLATNGEQAIEAVKKNPDIAVIIMDIVMPQMNGLEATVAIKAINPEISIIIQTAYVLEHTEDECLNAGCDVFFEKPISLIKLISSINELIKK